jgi:hypothetical protein
LVAASDPNFSNTQKKGKNHHNGSKSMETFGHLVEGYHQGWLDGWMAGCSLL